MSVKTLEKDIRKKPLNLVSETDQFVLAVPLLTKILYLRSVLPTFF